MTVKLPPRVAAIHDLSCFGRCALTVIIPVLSAMSCQTIPLPTALLSTHTGGFDGLYFRDLSDGMTEIADHFDRLELRFDAVYSGFLGSEKQISIVEDFIRRNSSSQKAPLVLVDPVMGDDGSLYSTYNDSLAQGIAQLACAADIITPNLTEACYMLGESYPDKPFDCRKSAESFAEKLCCGLSDKTGVGRIVVTGIGYEDRIGNYCMEKNEYSMVSSKKLARSFPGTGDIFASVLLGAVLHDKDLHAAVKKASDFTSLCIKASQDSPYPTRDGVLLETLVGKLVK